MIYSKFALMADELFMQRCLDLAQLAGGMAAPNPMVGAVLVHEGRIIGSGFHEVFGGHHAEVNCIESVRAEDRRLIPLSTLYVSLEPCAHHGKTPPCADRIVREGIPRVVIAQTDPFEAVSGRGIRILREAGIEVTTGTGETKALWMNRRFCCFHRQKRPYVILKWAMTADGYLAPEDRSRMQISNTHVMQLVHRWRTQETAIMAGYRTVLHDNPLLTARLWRGRQPLRVITDRTLSLPEERAVFGDTAPLWIINELRSAREGNKQLLQLPSGPDMLPPLMKALHGAGRLSLLVEGGPSLLQLFLDQGLWDEIRICRAGFTAGRGIPAPQLSGTGPARRTEVGNNTLEIYLNPAHAAAWPEDMPL